MASWRARSAGIRAPKVPSSARLAESYAKAEARRSGPAAWPVAGAEANPYAAPQAPVVAMAPAGRLAEGIDASRWMRFVARFVDNLFVGIVPGLIYAGVLISVGGNLEGSGNEEDFPVASCAALLFALLLALGLWIYNMVRLVRTGQTVGKTICNLRVVRMHGEPPTADHFVWRREIILSLLGLIPILGGFIGIADALAIFGAESRCLHDRLADTRVIEA